MGFVSSSRSERISEISHSRSVAKDGPHHCGQDIFVSSAIYVSDASTRETLHK